jgi:glycine amidinotransferase
MTPAIAITLEVVMAAGAGPRGACTAIQSPALPVANQPRGAYIYCDDSKIVASTSRVGDPTDMSLVNSYNEWAPLEEVVVGSPYHLDYHADTSFRLFFHDNLQDRVNSEIFQRPNFTPNNRLKEECLEDLDGLIKIIEEHGITVRRPELLDRVPLVQTPAWRAPMGHAMMPRDLFLVVGDEIIETPPMVRSRYFEGDLYKELFTEYFRSGARWTCAPKSRLLDHNFDYGYVAGRGYDGAVPAEPFIEMMFDAAQIARFGKDLIFNASTRNHRLGAVWLERHLGPEYRVHVVEVTDNHIDSKILPLRPGTLLIRDDVDLDVLPAGLHRWDMIKYTEFEIPVELEQNGVPFLASQSIGINVLSLDEEHVVVQDIQKPLIRNLERAGFTPIPCRWRHGRSLGGGFHCVTLDIRRQGGLESYF